MLPNFLFVFTSERERERERWGARGGVGGEERTSRLQVHANVVGTGSVCKTIMQRTNKAFLLLLALEVVHCAS